MMRGGFLFLALFSVILLHAQGLVINEFCARNQTVISDYYGNAEDWIEIKNNSAASIDLRGYCLTDNLGNLRKWRFPIGSSISSGQIILVWASNRDSTDPNGEFHTNFKIAAEGEPVALVFRETNTIVDQSAAIPLDIDVSYGRIGTSLAWLYFMEPTPRQENTTQGYSELLHEPVSSHPSGWYATPVEINFAGADADVELRWTTDGSDPSTDSPLWTGPLSLSDRSLEPNLHSLISPVLPGLPEPINELDLWYPPDGLVPKIHILKVRAFKLDALASNTICRTYLVDLPTSNLPIVSLVMKPDDLFDPDTGIYIAGNNYDGVNFFTANFMQDWERGIYTEWFDPNGSLLYAKAAEVKTHGTYSCRAGQKSLRIKPDALSGDIALSYPFFGEDYLSSFNSLILRNSGNDVHLSLFRDFFLQGLLKEQGLDTMNYRLYKVFLNGEYWGIYSLTEHAREEYIASHYNIALSGLDLLENNNSVNCGDALDYQALLSYLAANDPADPTVWQYLETKIDLNNFTEYAAAQIFIGNTDWLGNNIRYWRKRVPFTPEADYGHDGRWRWLVYDLDYSWGTYQDPYWIHDSLDRALDPSLEWRTFLLRRLMLNEDFKANFINTIADRLNSNWQSAKLISTIDGFESQLFDNMPQHLARWRLPNTMGLWLGEVNALRIFATNRQDFLRSLVVSQFTLPGVANIDIQITPPEAASIKVNNRVVLDNGNYKYFQGIPVSMQALVQPGWEIVSFAGTSSDSVYISPIAEQGVSLLLQRKIPQQVSLQQVGGMLKLSWQAIEQASGYRIETAEHPDSDTWDFLLSCNEDFVMLPLSAAKAFYRVRGVY